MTRTPAGPWTFEGSVASLGSPGETVTLVEETTFCLSDRSGDIVAGSTHGLVLLETRFVSELRLLVDGEQVEPLGTAVEQPFAAVFYGRVAGSGVLGEAPLVVRRSRRIGRGLVDVVRIEHHGPEHRIVEVTMCIAADFASVFEVKERRRTVATVLRADAQPGALRFVGERDGRASALRASSDGPATTELRGSSGRLTWRLDLPPRSSTEVCGDHVRGGRHPCRAAPPLWNPQNAVAMRRRTGRGAPPVQATLRRPRSSTESVGCRCHGYRRVHQSPLKARFMLTLQDGFVSPSLSNATLPTRGPVSKWLCRHLQSPVHELPAEPPLVDHPLGGEDSGLALYLCYELHYRGLPGVDEAWEWNPSLLRFRQRLEAEFMDGVIGAVGSPSVDMSPSEMRRELLALTGSSGGPSVSEHMAERGTLAEMREFCVHRSLYQLKEADPHSWAIPRLDGRSKAALIAIQIGEYGGGRPERVHAHLFAQTMSELGLDASYGAYLPLVPGVTLATNNLVSLFGLHRRWRGALVGHLAVFEMCSVGPMGNYAAGLRRLGLGNVAADFYDEHVLADETHQVIALDDLAGGLAESDPTLAGSVVFGARAVKLVEQRLAAHILTAWREGRTSLLRPLT
jgi:Iron-containing redox enzyme/N-terminal domain of (some) glycogen debranching enzymes